MGAVATATRLSVFSLAGFLLATSITAQPLSFDVASIKPNDSGAGGGSMGPRGSGFFATNMTLRNLVEYAFSIPRDAQLIGGPEWARTDHFDIEAKSAPDTPQPTPAQLRQMVQSLLEDRFQLKAHEETRELPVYRLALTKKGPKISDDQSPPDPRNSFITVASSGDNIAPLPRGALRMVNGPATTTITGNAIPISRILLMLQSKSERIVIDSTGLDKLIDINLEFRHDLSALPSDDAPPQSASLVSALQDAGLKLDPGKAPLEVLVLDRVQRPSGN